MSMAHNIGNFGSAQNLEYHPLGNIPSTYTDPNSLRPDTHAPRNTVYDSTAYSGNDISDYERNYNAPSPTSKTQYPSVSSLHNLSSSEIVSNPLSKPPQFSIRDWQWEFSASVFSLGCLAAVVGVLAEYRRHQVTRKLDLCLRDHSQHPRCCPLHFVQNGAAGSGRVLHKSA